ncbi:MAG: DUF2461 domain-containing protein [Dysgonamonadaceae bacterium]|jgi:uncharacterized protein (TIGR02453 family)|nr:DUF2461 domain-containing protein [Dysgonamonadaceae bacterium]
MENRFNGFTQDTFKFLKDLGENNCKPWFDEHKYSYELELLQPLKALVVAMTPAMYEIDNQFDFRTNRVLSRIYRDIRFSYDKTPYKDHMWITFQRMVPEWQNFPAFFMEISATGYLYGMGLYGSKKKIMDDMRERIEYEPGRFKEITQDLIGKHGYILDGEQYKRPLKNDLPEYFQAWMQRKSVYIHKRKPIGKELFDSGFAECLASEFALSKDLYEFFVDVCD